MDKEKERYHLCGGTFLTLLLHARRTPKKAQHKCLRDLLLTFDEGVQWLGEDSFKTVTSRFKSCDPKFSSEYIKLGSKYAFNSFEEAIRKDFKKVFDKFKVFIDAYIDFDKYGKWLVRALLELIEQDDLISDNEKLYVKQGFNPAYKYELKTETDFNFYYFLFGVWYYICQNCADNGIGHQTYFAWTKDKGGSVEREYISDIGLNTYENVTVCVETEEIVVEEKTVSAKASFRISPTEEILKQFGTPMTDEEIAHMNRTVKKREIVEKYAVYMKRAEDKHTNHRLFLYDVERPFYKFYVCNDVRRKIIVPVTFDGESKEDRFEPPIPNVNIKKFSQSRRQFLISGTGGLGKSMMMNHLMLDTIQHYDEYGLIPVFVTLKDFDSQKGDLLDFIYYEFKRHNPDFMLSDLTEIMKTGNSVILMDGLDEVASGSKSTFNTQLDVLMDRYPKSYYVVSVRPGTNYSTLSRFIHYHLQPFSLQQAIDMVSKLDGGVLKENSKSDFIEDLKENRFKFDRDEQNKFLGNPLFLSIMVRTYDVYHHIPTQRYIFYEHAYEAMASLHDANKSLTRDFETGLTSRDFQLYFGEFCAITYYDEKYNFTPQQIEDYLQEVIDANKLRTTTEAFIKDLTRKICVLYKDGGKYHFVHRSFQEYFAAYFFSKQLQQNFGAILRLFMSRDEVISDDDTLGMLYGMDPQKTELCIIIPYLEQLLGEEDDENSYHHFLLMAYQTLRYEQGDVNEWSIFGPALYVYKFIIDHYKIKHTLDGSELPFDEAFVVDEYAYYDESWFDNEEKSDYRLIKMSDMEIWQYHGYDKDFFEVVGWNFEIDLLYLFGCQRAHGELVEAIDDDNFSLKKEYHAAKKLLAELKAKYEKKEEVKSFISHFH